MSVQGSINQILGSVGAATGTIGRMKHMEKAQQSLREHEMQMLMVRTAAREKIEKRKASVERAKLKAKKQTEKSDAQLLAEKGLNLNNPMIAAQIKAYGIT